MFPIYYNEHVNPILYIPKHMNYPVDRADRRTPYVNYLPILKGPRKSPNLREPIIQIYSPQNGSPGSAVAECNYRAEGDLIRSSGLGVPNVRRQAACLNKLRWTERKARDPEMFF
jgi:hypothetical protein